MKRTLEEGEDGQEAKRIDDSASPRRAREKWEAHESSPREEQEKKQKVDDSSTDLRRPE